MTWQECKAHCNVWGINSYNWGRVFISLPYFFKEANPCACVTPVPHWEWNICAKLFAFKLLSYKTWFWITSENSRYRIHSVAFSIFAGNDFNHAFRVASLSATISCWCSLCGGTCVWNVSPESCRCVLSTLVEIVSEWLFTQITIMAL